MKTFLIALSVLLSLGFNAFAESGECTPMPNNLKSYYGKYKIVSGVEGRHGGLADLHRWRNYDVIGMIELARENRVADHNERTYCVDVMKFYKKSDGSRHSELVLWEPHDKPNYYTPSMSEGYGIQWYFAKDRMDEWYPQKKLNAIRYTNGGSCWSATSCPFEVESYTLLWSDGAAILTSVLKDPRISLPETASFILRKTP